MKKIAMFCIPAHGHTNPMLPVATELVNRGNQVRFYSFNEFAEKIRSTGAEFISCEDYLPKLTKEEEKALKNVSLTEMSIQDIRITLKLNDFLEKEFKDFAPDVVYTDSACFWGKLNAWKYHVPMVVSTSTFAFNEMSSKYMKHTPSELADMILGLPKISRELKTLKPYGYHVKSTLSLVQNDNDTDTVVYTSRKFQPCVESFSDHYLFAGPSVFSKEIPHKDTEKPLVYISMGTVINERPDFYTNCIEALKDLPVEMIISVGKSMDINLLGKLPENVKAYPYVNQLEILAKASVFITHCGMNSVSESLYMATPMVLYPQTGEQYAVARKTKEIGAGVMLEENSPDTIRNAVQEILGNTAYRQSAQVYSDDFRSCCGTTGIAEFIENAPHTSHSKDILKELHKMDGLFRILYRLIVVVLIVLFGLLISWRFVWIIGVTAGILSTPISKAVSKKNYQKLIRNL